MNWFSAYSSNTLAGSGNQFYFLSDKQKHTGRIYYKVYAGGNCRYSLLFSNILDSTYGDGSASRCNLLCDAWEITGSFLSVAETCDEAFPGKEARRYPLTFQGRDHKSVMPGEFFTSDPVLLSVKKGDFICLETEFRGRMIPCHEESILPAFIKENGKWIPSVRMPFPGMLGCDRNVRARVGFLGDSITQGIGTPVNSYAHWNALTAEGLGEDYSYWNLGLGYGRASDVASCGAWFYKARQMDFIIVCYGINDILHERTAEETESDLKTIITGLQKAGVKVMIQTLPPFDLTDEALRKWLHINTCIREELSQTADSFFDNVAILLDGPEAEGKSRYGAHPDTEGCKVWANHLIPVMRTFLDGSFSCTD